MDDLTFTRELVLIIGNGFDLHLNLKSKLKDFFIARVLHVENGNYIYNGENLLYFLFYYRYFASGTYNYEYFRRVDEDDPTWMDVEGFIKKIATSDKIISLLEEAYASSIRQSYLFTFHTSPITVPLRKLFDSRKVSKSGAESVIKQMLLSDLIDFEKDFQSYMLEQVKEMPAYENNKQLFLNKIVKQIVDDKSYSLLTHVFNFNYTSLETAVTYVSNVHGSLDKGIVIGFDSTTIKNYDECIYELSKDWQKVAVDDSQINLKQIDSDVIIFYGHSLGEQDYPYFFEIFDRLGLIEKGSGTTIYFTYSAFGSDKEQNSFKRNYQINIAKLLNSYENYKNSSIPRNTIITKLKSQGRLKLIKIDD